MTSKLVQHRQRPRKITARPIVDVPPPVRICDDDSDDKPDDPPAASHTTQTFARHPLRIHRVNVPHDVCEPEPDYGFLTADIAFGYQVSTVADGSPLTEKAALTREHAEGFRAAIDREYEQHRRNGTWEPTASVPSGHKLLGS
jgi:hypothetical protein